MKRIMAAGVAIAAAADYTVHSPQAVNDAANRELLELNRRYRTKEISEAQITQLSQAIDRPKSQAATRAYEQGAKLDAEQSGSAQAASGNVAIYLVHAPADPNATIIPLNASADPARRTTVSSRRFAFSAPGAGCPWVRRSGAPPRRPDRAATRPCILTA